MTKTINEFHKNKDKYLEKQYNISCKRIENLQNEIKNLNQTIKK